MKKIMESIKPLLIKYKGFFIYLSTSFLATGVDVAIVWSLLHLGHLNIVLANTVGISGGCILSYLLCSKKVFNADYGIMGLTIYVVTSIGGLLLGDSVIYVSYHYLFNSLGEEFSFLLSKGLSIMIPFFAMYGVRKRWYAAIEKKSSRIKEEKV